MKKEETENIPSVIVPTPTHRCKICGALWVLWGDSDVRDGGGWSVVSASFGKCCDNVAMGDQIEKIFISPHSREWLSVTPETMPPAWQGVLCVSAKHEDVFKGHYRGDGTWGYYGGDDDVEVARWQPLPQA